MIVPSSNHSKYLVFIPVTFALILESCKIFFFFQNHLCTTPMWELLDPISIVRVSNGENIDMPNTDPNTSPSLDHFHVASTCSLNRASYASIACLSLYFFAFILVLYHIWTTHKQQRRFERLSTIQNGNVGSFYSYHTSKTGRTKQSTSEPYIDPRRLSVSALTLDTCHQSESMNSLNHFDERHRKSSRSFKQYDRSGMSRQSSLLSSSSEKTRKKDNSKSSLMRSTDQFSLSSISSDLKSTGTRGGGGKSSSQRFHDSRKEPRWGSTSGAPIRNDRSSTPGQLPITYYTLGHDYRQTSKSSSRLERTPSRPKSARQVSNANHSRRVMSRAASIAALPRNK